MIWVCVCVCVVCVVCVCGVVWCGVVCVCCVCMCVVCVCCVCVCVLQVRAEWVGGKDGCVLYEGAESMVYLNPTSCTPLNSPLSIPLPPTFVYSRPIPPAQLNPFQHHYAPISMSLNMQTAVPHRNAPTAVSRADCKPEKGCRFNNKLYYY